MRLLIAEDEVDLAEALTVFLRKSFFGGRRPQRAGPLPLRRSCDKKTLMETSEGEKRVFCIRRSRSFLFAAKG